MIDTLPVLDRVGRSGGMGWARAGRSGSNSGVECNLAKVDVEGSNPFSRSIFFSIFPGCFPTSPALNIGCTRVNSHAESLSLRNP